AIASVTPLTTPSPAPTVEPADWNALRVALRDGLVRSGDATYDAARVLYNTRFDGVRPQAVARCATVEDVRECVRFARAYGIPLALRSGGHSYGGWSTGPGLVIDGGRSGARLRRGARRRPLLGTARRRRWQLRRRHVADPAHAPRHGSRDRIPVVAVVARGGGRVRMAGMDVARAGCPLVHAASPDR